MTPADRAIVDGHTSLAGQPGASTPPADDRRADADGPETYQYESGSWRGGQDVSKYSRWTCSPSRRRQQAQAGLPPQSLTDRISVCASIAARAALFERHGLVYLDWSYANIFWCRGDHSAYVIDLDGCSFGPRPQIQTPSWDDPHVPLGTTAGNESDRYRVALLIARCLTGQRGDPSATQLALGARAEPARPPNGSSTC